MSIRINILNQNLDAFQVISQKKVKVFIPDLPEGYQIADEGITFKPFVEVKTITELNTLISPIAPIEYSTGNKLIAYDMVYNSLVALLSEPAIESIYLRFSGDSGRIWNESDSGNALPILPEVYGYQYIYMLYSGAKAKVYDEGQQVFDKYDNFYEYINGNLEGTLNYKKEYDNTLLYSNIYAPKYIEELDDTEDWKKDIREKIKEFTVTYLNENLTPVEKANLANTFLGNVRLEDSLHLFFVNYFEEGNLLPSATVALIKAARLLREGKPYLSIAGQENLIWNEQSTGEVAIQLSKKENDKLREIGLNVLETKRNIGTYFTSYNTAAQIFPDKRANVISLKLYLREAFILFLDQFRQQPNIAKTWRIVENSLKVEMNKLLNVGAINAVGVDCGLGSTMTRQDILEGRLIARVVYRPVMLIDDIALNIIVTTEEVNIYFDTNLGIGGSV